MKVTLKYEETEDEALHMTLRLTLTKKYVSGPTKDVVRLFVDHYNKKHTENKIDTETLHLKIVGGDHLEHQALVEDTLSNGNECYLLPPDGGSVSLRRAAAAAAEKAAAAEAAAAASAAAAAPAATAAPVEKKDDQGLVRCKRFGCKRSYDPNGPPQECVHHKSPPIFHEVAKWWSCCPDTKAYDWDEFMKIPGCQKSYCSATPEGQKDQKRFLGGSDLRGDCAPTRLDANAPADPRHKLNQMMKGLVAIGVDEQLFEKVWAKHANESDDLEKVVTLFRTRFAAVLNSI